MTPNILEVELGGRVEFFEPDLGKNYSAELIVAEIKNRFSTSEELFFFVRETDSEYEFTSEIIGEILVAHRARKIIVQVNYEHLTKEHEFSPSATIYQVLQWAIGKHGYELDPMARSKANLILPGTQVPLSRDDVIAKFAHDRVLKVDLTLRDFTNG
jgi:hypothetical protein